MCDKTSSKCGETPSNFDLYKIALETRNFEIELFWKRSNYFLVLNTAVAVGYFGMDSDNCIHKMGINFFGFIVSVLWLWINLGSKYWQAKWEQELEEIEGMIGCRKMFYNNRKKIDEKVEQNLNPSGRKKKWIHECVMKKPSVSMTMINLSVLFIFAWFVLFIISVGPQIYQLLCRII